MQATGGGTSDKLRTPPLEPLGHATIPSLNLYLSLSISLLSLSILSLSLSLSLDISISPSLSVSALSLAVSRSLDSPLYISLYSSMFIFLSLHIICVSVYCISLFFIYLPRFSISLSI